MSKREALAILIREAEYLYLNDEMPAETEEAIAVIKMHFGIREES